MADFSEVRFPGADGRLSLFARDYGGDGLPLVLMHGLTRNSTDFESLADRLQGRFRVVVPDQRGRGRSDRDDDPANYALPMLCADALGLIARLGLERPVLVGTSMGGLMAMGMAAANPSAFRGLVLNDVGPQVEAEGLARIAGYAGKAEAIASWDEAAAYARRINESAFPHYGEAQWLAFARRTFRQQADGTLVLDYDPAIAQAGAGAPIPDLWPVWEALASLPVLAIRGGTSDILSAATLEQMAARHPRLTACTVPGIGHAPMLDEPEAVAAIEAFLTPFA
jgi:pimeloyl-ACP methyl ester carboxylesterase